MVAEHPTEQLSYEQALRVIGRHLDAEPAHHISVMEVADGFTVRSHPSQQRSDARTVHFSWERLRDLFIFQASGRGCQRKHHRHQGMWQNFPHGHEDFFRALGHIIDRDKATSVTVDELPEGIAVSYIVTDPDNPPYAQKVYAVMREGEIQTMLEAAQKRRGTGLRVVPDQP